MIDGEIQRLLELIGPHAKDDPKVKGLLAALNLTPSMRGTVVELLTCMVRQAGIDLSDPATFPSVSRLPEGGTRIGTVINGTREGPVFYVPEGSALDLENVGLFGLPRWGKSYLLMAIARHTMQNGNTAWLFDVEDELSQLLEAVSEPYRPVIISPKDLRINLYQPPNDQIDLDTWLLAVAFLLRGEVFIRDGGQNLFQDCLERLLKSKGSFTGSGRFPSLAETLCYFQGLKLGGSEVRGKSWQESLINRMKMLCNTYKATSHVTNSNMLELLATKSVIFRLHNLRGIPLHFLINFILMWLAAYKQSVIGARKLQTVGIDEHHLLRADRGRNDIGSDTLEGLFATGAKRGLRIVLSNQIISKLDEGIFGNLGCRVITRVANPRDILLIRQSMGMSLEQAKGITQLEKREVIVSYGGHPKPFKVKVDEFSFPPKPDDEILERNAQAFLEEVAWNEDSMLAGGPVESPEAITGDVLRVFVRIGEKVEIIDDRCQSLNISRATDVRARAVLEAKGYIAEENQTLGNKFKFYQITPKGAEWAKSRGIKVRLFKSGPAHEYLLDQVEKGIGRLNPQYKFQRNSEIAREHGIQPDSVLIQPLGYRSIIEIVCHNIEHEARTLVKETGISGVDMVIAIVPNQRVKRSLQRAVDRCRVTEAGAEPAMLVILDAGKCLSVKFDWISVFERP